ncbi:hypothetical protein ACFL2Q_06545 [Thermodesulfobacteriota bacterium]
MNKITVCWVIGLVGSGLIGLAAWQLGQQTPVVWEDTLSPLILAAVIGILVAIVWGFQCARLLTPSRIETDYIWLKGVNRDYLSQLPNWHEG